MQEHCLSAQQGLESRKNTIEMHINLTLLTDSKFGEEATQVHLNVVPAIHSHVFSSSSYRDQRDSFASNHFVNIN